MTPLRVTAVVFMVLWLVWLVRIWRIIRQQDDEEEEAQRALTAEFERRRRALGHTTRLDQFRQLDRNARRR